MMKKGIFPDEKGVFFDSCGAIRVSLFGREAGRR